MAGIWVRAGTVTLTNGSKKVTGSGTAWNTGTNKVTKGCAFIYNNIAYEVDYINSDTELYWYTFSPLKVMVISRVSSSITTFIILDDPVISNVFFIITVF